MQLHKGPLTYTRFLTDKLISTHDVEYPAFKPIDPHGVAEVSVAFCDPQDPDEPFRPAGLVQHLAVRIDTLKVPTAILKAKVATEAKVRARAQLRDRLTKREIDLLTHKIRQQLRHKTEPRTKVVHVYLATSCVRIFATGGTAMRVVELLEAVFGVELSPLGVLTLAAQANLDGADALSTTEPAAFHLPAPVELAKGGSVDPRPFLGREFLTWLWYRVTQDDGQALGLQLVESMSLSGGGLVAERVTVQDDVPDQSEEAKTALRCGKKVDKLRFALSSEQFSYTATIDAHMQLSSVRLPNESDADGIEAGVLMRMSRLDEVEAWLEQTYCEFIDVRASADWLDELQAMCAWVQEA